MTILTLIIAVAAGWIIASAAVYWIMGENTLLLPYNLFLDWREFSNPASYIRDKALTPTEVFTVILSVAIIIAILSGTAAASGKRREWQLLRQLRVAERRLQDLEHRHRYTLPD